jgi:hypothetical protein
VLDPRDLPVILGARRSPNTLDMYRIGHSTFSLHGFSRLLRGDVKWAQPVLVLLVTGISIWLVWRFRQVLDRHEGTAAWVQAAGAIIIVATTAWIAGRSSREAHERERTAKIELCESIAAIARNCLDAIDALLRCPWSAADPRGSFLRAYAPSDFEVPMDGLAAVPLHHIGDARLITALLTLRGVMGRIKKQLDDIRDDPLLSPALEPIRNQQVLAFNAVASILRIVYGSAAEQEISRLAAR